MEALRLAALASLKRKKNDTANNQPPAAAAPPPPPAPPPNQVRLTEKETVILIEKIILKCKNWCDDGHAVSYLKLPNGHILCKICRCISGNQTKYGLFYVPGGKSTSVKPVPTKSVLSEQRKGKQQTPL